MYNIWVQLRNICSKIGNKDLGMAIYNIFMFVNKIIIVLNIIEININQNILFKKISLII